MHWTKTSAARMREQAAQLEALAVEMEMQDEAKASSTDEVVIYSAGLHVGRITACIEGVTGCLKLFGVSHLPTQ